MIIHIDRVLLTSAENKNFLNDFLKRVNFCDGIRRKMRTDVSFLSHVLFSDEANFPNTGNLNRHNIHYSANENSNSILLNWYIPFLGTVNAVICLDSSPVAWPPRLPDLTSPDYFWWGSVKEHLMAVATTTPDDMIERIRRACTEITPQMLADVRRSFHRRINKCLQVKGHHFEYLLWVDTN